MNAASPPTFCASAMMCSDSVVLPDDSGPKISTMRPRGTPPTPRAASTPMDPVEMALTAANSFAPSLMIEPLPNWRSIWVSAVSAAFNLSVGMLTILLAPLKRFSLKNCCWKARIDGHSCGESSVRTTRRTVKKLYTV